MYMTNNYNITLETIVDKIIKSEKVVEHANSGGDYLDEAYIHLNNSIRLQQISSMRRLITKRKGILARIALWGKYVIRKLVYWFIEPICVDQTKFNEQITQYAIKLFYYLQSSHYSESPEIDEHGAQMNELKRLEEYIESINTLCEEHKIQIQEIKKEKEVLFEELKEFKDNYNILSKKYAEICDSLDEFKELKQDIIPDGTDHFWEKTTYSQSGEDSILQYIIRVLGINVKESKYIDLGANHAKKLSNTYILYKIGMRGVLVEANPNLIGELKFYRNQDIIVNKCISEKSKESKLFYIMSGDGLSCMDIDSVNEAMRKNPSLHITKTLEVETISINDLLEKYFDVPPTIMSIDIEGMEERILKDIDYTRFAPLIIIVERIEYSTTIAVEKRNDDIDRIMEHNGYIEYAYTGINSIYINKKRLGDIINENSI